MTKDSHIKIEQLEWVAIPAELKPGLARQGVSKRQLRQWTLVLQSRQIPCRTEKDEKGFQLLVPPHQFQQACRELIEYEQENRNWPPPPPPDQKFHENTASTIWVLILLALFHNLTAHHANPFGQAPINWLALGNAYTEKILNGEWWRLITALTLHSGPVHLAGNIVVGGVFIVRLCWILGSGYAWLLVLLSGAFGNLINTLVQSPHHRSIGASTAVFGAVGLLAAINMLRYRQSLWRRWPLPVAAALGLLALLGTGGENTDILAHLFGFLSGIGLGVLSTYLPHTYNPRKPLMNRIMAALSGSLIIAAWWLALR